MFDLRVCFLYRFIYLCYVVVRSVLKNILIIRERPIWSVIVCLSAYIIVYALSLNYLNIYLFPRRSVAEVTLPSTVTDRGGLEMSNQHIKVPVPKWLATKDQALHISPRGDLLALAYGDHVLALFAWERQQHKKAPHYGLSEDDYEVLDNILEDDLDQKLAKAIKQGRGKKRSRLWRDRDHDRIPDTLDLHIGLLKSMRNHARYDASFHGVKYPNGDVDRSVGVCTDVVVRAYRNAGINLQEMVIKDMQRAPKAYSLEAGKSPNKHYEHRRVRRLYPYFKRHFKKLSTDFDSSTKGDQAWLPGDILFMSFEPWAKKPRHVGLASSHIQLSGFPLLAHNAARFFYASEHDILFAQPIFARFRVTLPK